MTKRDYYQRVAEAILVEARVRHVVYLDRAIRAYSATEGRRLYIVAPRPTTADRVLGVAHEAGHIYLQHTSGLPSHRREYEAEQYSYATLRRFGIPLDPERVSDGKTYVAWKLEQAAGSIKRICQQSYKWCEPYLRQSPRGRQIIQEVEASNIVLIDMKRPDPTEPPRARKQTLEITYYQPGTWHARTSKLAGLRGDTKRYTPTWSRDFDQPATPPSKPRPKKPQQADEAFAAILRRAIDQSGESVRAISKASGIPQPVLARFYNGTRDNLRLDVAERLAKRLGYTLTKTAD